MAVTRRVQGPPPRWAIVVCGAILLGLPVEGQQGAGAGIVPPPRESAAFGEPRRVSLRGYRSDAMEPFVTKDGRYLLFNNRNDPRIDTRLHFAERDDDLTFDYRGALRGVNTSALEGVPSLDRHGNLYFVSTRSYRETLATIYRGRFDDGAVSGVEIVGGVSPQLPGIVNFDAEISADGDTLFVVDGRFSGGPVPETADIDIVVRDEGGFRRLPAGRELLANVNSDRLEYAPAVSTDLLELFFTRLDRSKDPLTAQILHSVRSSLEDPFGPPEEIPSITGFVEAPTLSSDGHELYFHRRESGRFVIYRVTR